MAGAGGGGHSGRTAVEKKEKKLVFQFKGMSEPVFHCRGKHHDKK